MRAIETAINLDLAYFNETRPYNEADELRYIASKVKFLTERQFKLYNALIELKECQCEDADEYLNRRNEIKSELRNISIIISIYNNRI